MKDDVIICRCEEIAAGKIKQAVREGATSIDGVKRMTRAGKGLCQGRTCRCLVERLVSEETGKPAEQLEYPSVRPPVRVMRVRALALEEQEGGNEA